MGLDEVSGADFWCIRICATSPIDLARFRLDLTDPKSLDLSVDPTFLDFSGDPKAPPPKGTVRQHPPGGGARSFKVERSCHPVPGHDRSTLNDQKSNRNPTSQNDRRPTWPTRWGPASKPWGCSWENAQTIKHQLVSSNMHGFRNDHDRMTSKS